MESTGKTTSHFTPTYIVNQRPGKYGGCQEDYLRRCHAVVQKATEELSHALAEGAGEEKLKELYLSFFHSFRDERQQIACDHYTFKAELFGRMRTHPKAPTFYHTILDGEYAEYGMKIKSVLKGLLDQMGQTKKKTFNFPVNPDFPRNSCVEVEILEQQTLVERKWLFPPSPEEIGLPNLEYNELGQLTHNSLAQIRKYNKPLYQRLKMFQELFLLQNEFPSPKTMGHHEGGTVFDHPEREKNLKSFFVHAVVKQEVEGKLYHVCEYLTWLYRNHRTDPCERMLRDSTVVVFHMDKHNIDHPAMGDLGTLFAKAVLSDERQLKYAVSEYRRFQGFVMPICRGSASVTEWFEHLIFNVRHHQLSYKNDVHPDLEGLATPSAAEYDTSYAEGKFHTWES